jgi:hypothetical protein
MTEAPYREIPSIDFFNYFSFDNKNPLLFVKYLGFTPNN